MTMHPHHTFMPSPWRRISCSLFLIAAVLATVAAVASPRVNQGGSTSPIGDSPWLKARVNLADSANSSDNAGPLSQRIAKDAFHQKIAPWVVEHTTNGQQAEFFVVLADQADLSRAGNLATKTEKGRYVYDTLLKKAQTTQRPILQWLREHGLEHRSFYIVNAILVKGTRQIAEALAARPDVARVEGNPMIHNNLPQPGPAVKALRTSGLQRRSSRASITPTHHKCGHSDLLDKTLLSGVPTPVFAGRKTRSNLTIAAGTVKTPITITTGTTLSMTA